jgi:lysophospholipase L1-like esterase
METLTMTSLRAPYRLLVPVLAFVLAWLLLACTAARVQAQAPAAAVNTDPARAQVVLPEPANPALPSILLIGDSTVRNGHDDGQGKGAQGQWGWGNPLAAHVDASKVNLVNRAVGGLSSRTYISSGHWARTLALVKPGDIVIMQFGHNDASPVNDDKRARGSIRGVGDDVQEIDNLLTGKRETVHSYGWYLRKFIADTRAKGATPVVASLIPRKAWIDEGPEQGTVRRNGADYAGWAREVARSEQVGFIDLNELVARRYDAMGREGVMAMFPATVPEERIHTNWAGASLNAQVVATELKALGDARMAVFLKPVDDVRPVVDARTVRDEAPRDPALPTLFLVGDSTVKSGGQNGAIGWGERITPFFDTRRINVVNAAIGGRSSRTFFTEGRWDRVVAQLKRGDVVLIQFGHNDGGRIGDPASKNRASVPGTGLDTVEDTRTDGSKEQVHSFGWYLARYVADAKAKGATVIIASPIPHRDKWQDERDFASFADWGREVARSSGAHFMDLTQLVSDAYRAIGAATVDTFFSDARTHTNAAGAEFNARQVVAGLAALPGDPLRPYFAAQGPCNTWGERGALLYQDDFDGPLTGYISEYARKPGNKVANVDGRLLLDVDSGATVWLDKPLSGNLLIAYTRRVVVEGGPNDRLSDLNHFWMAQDPHRASLFTRSGAFEEYDDLDLYYAGIGGNDNTTTRMRRYGDGKRELVGERLAPTDLLEANRDYRIEILVRDGCTRMRVDGRDLFTYHDPRPLTRGYFGFRTTWSRQTIDGLTIHHIK